LKTSFGVINVNLLNWNEAPLEELITAELDKKFLALYGILNLHCRVHKSPPLVSLQLKVKLSLCLISYVDIWESEDIATTVLTSALYGDEWSASSPSHFIPEIKFPVLIG
jgi:hypothetical protein